MDILSFEFFVFTFIAVLIYWICPKKYRWTALLVSNLVFVWYANSFSRRACAVMVFLILAAYIAGLLFERFAQNMRMKKLILACALLSEAGLLIILKDMDFLRRYLPFGIADFKFVYLIAPLGVSYFTLSLIGYILDTYWGSAIERNPLKFFLFGSYFPLLTSGPIVKYSDTGKELVKSHDFSYERMCFGVQRILWGIFKKIVLSERLAVIVNTVYGNPAAYPGLYVWTAMVLFVLQLYTDFSGCLDIIYGVSELFGIALPENFDLPFASGSLSEFWRKWHITLGLWLKSYILYPVLKSKPLIWLGGKSKKWFGKKYGKKIPTWCGLFVSWFLIGFWHGGSWNYIIGVGLWMWFVIVLGDASEGILKRAAVFLQCRTDCFSWNLFRSVRTFLLFAFGLGMFPASSFMSGLEVYKAGFSVFNPWIFFNESFLGMGLTVIDYSVLRISVLTVVIAGIIKLVKKVPVREWISEQNVYFRWSVWIGLFLIVLIYGKYGPGYDAAEFIYRGF